jgi:hypothetical protein
VGYDEDDDDAERRFPHNWHAYLISDDRESVVRIPARLLDRIRRQSDGTLQQYLERALELYAEKLEADAESWVPGSASPPVTTWSPPEIADPASPEEKRKLVPRLLAACKRSG